MSRINDGTEPSMYGLPDMSLRDYFAVQALAGWLAGLRIGRLGESQCETLATGCYQMADAMLVVRAKLEEAK